MRSRRGTYRAGYHCPGSLQRGQIRTFPGDDDRCSVCGKWVRVRSDETVGLHTPVKDRQKYDEDYARRMERGF